MGEICNSKPCAECTREIKRRSRFMKIKKVVYSVEKGFEVTDVNQLFSTHKSSAQRTEFSYSRKF